MVYSNFFSIKSHRLLVFRVLLIIGSPISGSPNREFCPKNPHNWSNISKTPKRHIHAWEHVFGVTGHYRLIAPCEWRRKSAKIIKILEKSQEVYVSLRRSDNAEVMQT